MTTPGVRTIADLAALAGVSPGTVSRALSGRGWVNAATRDRIRDLAQAHDFTPNQMASRLRMRRTDAVGVVVPLGHERRQHLSDPFFSSMIGHLGDALTEQGFDIVLSRVIPDADDWLERITSSGMVDGVLLIGQSDQFDTIEKVARGYRPLVAWGTHVPGQTHCAVGIDNRGGGRLAGERLIARGCRRVAFMGEVRTLELGERHAGLVEALRAAGLPDPLQLDTHLASDIMSAEIEQHLDRHGGDIDGIAAASDVIAIHAVRALADRGRRVPDDMLITGFDDLPMAAYMVPRLTTVRQDLAHGAQEMVRALFARIAGEDAPSVEMPAELIERDTA